MTDTEPEYVDPFEEEWDDEEMAVKQAEYQRLLDDAGASLTAELDRVAGMSDDEQAYLANIDQVEDETTGVEMDDVEGSLDGDAPTPIQTDISTNELGSQPEPESGV